MRPRVAITPWRRELPTFLGERTVLDTLDPAYAERVQAAGGLALVVPRPPGDLDETAEEVARTVDALLLSGGGDVHPSTYGEDDAGAQDADPRADAWELALARAARRHALPTLGICRGAQVLAVAAGGRLRQHVDPDELHPAIAGRAAELILADRHPVELAEGSRVRQLFACPTLVVNTIHHQAIEDPGALRVTAAAPGGLVEAVEPADGWPALGVQWHPEKMDEPEQRRLFAHLVDRAREHAP